MCGACALSLVIFCARDLSEERARLHRLAAEKALQVDEETKMARFNKMLEVKVDQTEEYLHEKANEAAVSIQRYARGTLARKSVGKLLDMTRGTRTSIKRGWKWLLQNTWQRIQSDHRCALSSPWRAIGYLSTSHSSVPAHAAAHVLTGCVC
jgi:hypothetical protein